MSHQATIEDYLPIPMVWSDRRRDHGRRVTRVYQARPVVDWDRRSAMAAAATGRTRSPRVEVYFRWLDRHPVTETVKYWRSAGRTRPPPTRARIVRTYHPYVRPSTHFARR